MNISELQFFPLLEMLDSRFVSSIDWSAVDGTEVGYGEIDGERVQLRLEPITFHEHQGFNLSFAVWDGEKFSENMQAKSLHGRARLIGAVTNGLIDHLQSKSWEFLTAVAKDGIDSRGPLYLRIAMRIAREHKWYFDSLNVRGAAVTVVSKTLPPLAIAREIITGSHP